MGRSPWPNPAVNGYLANTDPEWYAFLRPRVRPPGRLDEVNFWRPSERIFRALRSGEPFLFRIKAPHNAICGFAQFEYSTPLPAWLAWEVFEEGNGVASLQILRERLERLQEENRIRAGEHARIACIVLGKPVLFAPDEWVRLPDDWSPRIQTGKLYDLSTGQGARMWRECLDRAALAAPPVAADSAERYGPAALVRQRLGQAGFRLAVLDAYGRACAVTSEHSLPVLEAAHIRPYAEGGVHDVRNGLLLRSDLHRLFDRGYVTVTPDGAVRVSSMLRADFANGRSYYPLDGQTIHLPARRADRPDRDLLAWHASDRFLG